MPYCKTIPFWLEIALAELGVHEILGSVSSDRINEYLKTCSLAPNDEIPWCSAFVNWVMAQTFIKGTNNGMARSWLTWGEVTEPRLGCIVVFSRPEGGATAGHVGIQLDNSAGKVTVIGGNQNNRVGISQYLAATVLGYRWPKSLFNI